LESYERGLPYAPKLPEERYKHYLLNAGSVHMAEGKFKESLNIYRDARQTFSGLPSDVPTLEVYGRTLLGEAAAQLDMVLYQNQAGIDLDTLVIDLRHAASMFDLAGSLDRYASAQSTLALAHALNGNMDDALPVLDLAFNQIRQHGFRKQHLEALYHRALIRFLNHDYTAALADIETALALSNRFSIAEFDTRLNYLKGQAYEDSGQPEEASTAYETAFNVANDSAMGRDRHLSSLAATSAFRISAKIPRKSPFAFLTFGFLGVVVLAITFFALLAYFVSMAPHRRKKHALQAGPEAVADTTPPTPEATPAEEAPSAPPEPSLATPTQATTTFTRCYRRAYEALTEPEEVATLIDDPILSKYLKQGGVKQKGELYEVTASLVTALDGKEVDSAGVRSALTRGFKKRGWTWPKSFESLRRHFLEHPPQGV